MLKRMIVLLLSINLLLTACATALEEPSNPSDPSWQALPVSAVLALDFENTTADAVHPEESLSLHGISVFTEGVSGQALGLDGSSYLELPNAAQRLSGQMSLSCWVKSEAPLEGNQPLLWFFPDQQQAGIKGRRGRGRADRVDDAGDGIDRKHRNKPPSARDPSLRSGCEPWAQILPNQSESKQDSFGVFF